MTTANTTKTFSVEFSYTDGPTYERNPKIHTLTVRASDRDQAFDLAQESLGPAAGIRSLPREIAGR